MNDVNLKGGDAVWLFIVLNSAKYKTLLASVLD